MICYKCGTKLDDNAKFCYKCGLRVSDIMPSEKENPVTEEVQMNNQSKFYPEESELEQENNITELTKEDDESFWKKASLTKKAVCIIGGIALFFILIAILKKFGAIIFGVLIVVSIGYSLFKGTAEEKKEAKSFVIKCGIGIVVIFVISILLVIRPNFVSDIVRPGAGVRDAYLTAYSDKITIENAFNNYFENEKWSVYDDDEGYSYVAFNGTCSYNNKKADIRITFKITGENFIVNGLDINGIGQSDILLYALLDNIYKEANKH